MKPIVTDHLGSVSGVIDDATNAWQSRTRYSGRKQSFRLRRMEGHPFAPLEGEERDGWGTPPTDYKFTGQREEAEIGLYFYQARWYDSQLGHFAQADWIIPNLGISQGWDRYAYSYNNPVRYVDPSGHEPYVDGDSTFWDQYNPSGDEELDDDTLNILRNSGLLDAWGLKMLTVYTWFRDNDGWWNSDGDFTLTEFLAMALHIEYDKGPRRESLYTAFGQSAKYKIAHIGSIYDPRGSFDVYASVFIYIGERETMRNRFNNNTLGDKGYGNNVGGYDTWLGFARDAFPTVFDFGNWDLDPTVPFEFKNYSYYNETGQNLLANAAIGLNVDQKYDGMSYYDKNKEPMPQNLVILTFQQNEYWQKYKAGN